MAFVVQDAYNVIATYLKIDTASPPLDPNTDELEILNDLYLQFFDKFTIKTGTVASGAAVSTSFWQFTVGSLTFSRIESIEFTSGGVGLPLDVLPEDEIRWMQSTEGRVGDPQYTSWRLNVSDAAGVVISGYLYPIRTAIPAIAVNARTSANDLASTADTLQLNPHDFFTLCRIAALQIGASAGRPRWLLERIAKPIPEKMRIAFDVARMLLREPTASSADVPLPEAPDRRALRVPEISRMRDER